MKTDGSSLSEKPTPESPGGRAIGLVECSSVARGLEVADAMLKAAAVTLLVCQTVCPGKYLVAVGGEVAAVSAAVEAGRRVAADTLVDEVVIPRVHPQVLQAFAACGLPEKLAALGLVETFSLAAAVVAGDQAVKSAKVDLLEIRLGRALGGKAFVLLSGEVAAVRAAVQAAEQAARAQGLLLGSSVIPAPHPDLAAGLL